MTYDLWKGVSLAGLQRPRLDDQVAVARSFADRCQVDAYVDHAAAEVGGRKLVNDSRGAAWRHILRSLRVFHILGGDDVYCDNWHEPVLSGYVAGDVEGFSADALHCSNAVGCDGTAACGCSATKP